MENAQKMLIIAVKRQRVQCLVSILLLTDGEVRGNGIQNSWSVGDSIEKSSILSIGSSQVDN